MFKALTITTLLLAVLAISVQAQTFEDEPLPIDKVIEEELNHNVDVAWQYFRLKKAYKASLLRMEESLATLSAFPTYKKMDEVIFIYGMSSYYLAEGKGSQKIVLERLREEDRERFTKAKLLEDAEAYLSKLVEDHPESKYRDKAEDALKKLKKN
ncbi:MAG: outer membrane protein assembly factor BamD [Acidobacteria bacterium]|nr:MAG: outer membrane protein assembly factor BamD [Acidobacteriota bacterium]REK02706.1 MAG: outer membrane protein assembly factor BamD [Acidobacteriota bacterium]REK13489.1 MAG: outer membrane protein assembly factor BamD [Acidobacteriota bacterium]REK41483.1 MAG: outer membrane protein assembly factor BamD [Acidobacteriota bacterium]